MKNYSTKAELLAEKRKEFELTEKTLLAIPEELKVYNVSEDSVHMADSTFDEAMEALHQLRKTFRLELFTYYLAGDTITGNDRVCLYYHDRDKDLTFLFYCTDVEHTLSKIGNGKCKVVDKTETKREIVCATA